MKLQREDGKLAPRAAQVSWREKLARTDGTVGVRPRWTGFPRLPTASWIVGPAGCPTAQRPELDQDYVAPADDTSSDAIAEVWKQRARYRSEWALRDNFFDLGGHSLLLVNVHDALRDRFDGPVSIVDLLRYPTVESLSRFVTLGRGGSEDLREARDRAARQREVLARQTRPRRGPGGK